MRKNLWTAIAAVGLCLAVPGLGRAGLITFDEGYVAGVRVPVNYFYSDGLVLTDSYAAEGVHFSGPQNGDGAVNGGVILYNPGGKLHDFGVAPHSGTNVLAFNRTAQLGGGPLWYYPNSISPHPGMATDPETITFDSTQSQVSIWAAGGLLAHQFLIQGFDANNSLVDSQTVTTQDWAELTVSGGGIQSVVLTEIPDPNNFSNGAFDSWVYDDLSFTPDRAGVAGEAPEPAGLVLLGIGGFGLVGWRWRMGKH